METLTTAHAQGQLGIPVPGVDKDFEMHPSGPSAVNPATRMPPPLPVKPADHEQSQSQEKEVASLQAEAVGFGSRVSPGVESLHPTSPSISQTQVQDDASQPEPRLGSPEDQSNSQTEPKTTPARHKRTASGILKAVDTPSDVRPRAESVSSSGSKAGEVAAQLKTRLAYAMAKVQHGWEHRNINEVEQLAAALHPRPVASPPSSSAPVDIRSPPSKRRSASGVVSWSLPDSGVGLGPPVNGSSQNSNGFKHPSASSPSSQIPSTPKSRPPPLQVNMPTQQAEQDAMDALMLMGGSPGNGGKFALSQSSSSQNAPHSQSQQSWQSTNSPALVKRRPSDSSSLAGRSPKRPAVLSRNHSSASEVSVANSEVREARERVLDEAEEAA